MILLVRCARRSLRRFSSPRLVKVIRLDGAAVEESTLTTVSVFFLLYLLLLAAVSLVVALDGVSLTTAFTAALACLSNIGPGLDAVGPAGNFAALSGVSKLVLTFAMLAGRLELFPILILLRPDTWRRTCQNGRGPPAACALFPRKKRCGRKVFWWKRAKRGKMQGKTLENPFLMAKIYPFINVCAA